MHDETDTLERHELIRTLRLGDIDVLVGINLLREGLDIPEVSLVAILDADQEGFLRSETTLVQTMGRAARNVTARWCCSSDDRSNAMQSDSRTQRRRRIQQQYNEDHGFEPTTIEKEVGETNLHGSKTETVGIRVTARVTPTRPPARSNSWKNGCRRPRTVWSSNWRRTSETVSGNCARSSTSTAATTATACRHPVPSSDFSVHGAPDTGTICTRSKWYDLDGSASGTD